MDASHRIIEYVSSREIYDVIVDALKMGLTPIPRSHFGGLTLRQISDGLKIAITVIYLNELTGQLSETYERIKPWWIETYEGLPLLLARSDEWAKCQELPIEQRKMKLFGLGSKVITDASCRNQEEIEFYNDETMTSFFRFLELVGNNSNSPMEFMLGYISARYVEATGDGHIYFSDQIPIIPKP